MIIRSQGEPRKAKKRKAKPSKSKGKANQRRSRAKQDKAKPPGARRARRGPPSDRGLPELRPPALCTEEVRTPKASLIGEKSVNFRCFLLNAATNSWFWAHLRYSWWGCLAWGRFQPSRSAECIEDGGLQPSRIPILSTWSLWNT